MCCCDLPRWCLRTRRDTARRTPYLCCPTVSPDTTTTHICLCVTASVGPRGGHGCGVGRRQHRPPAHRGCEEILRNAALTLPQSQCENAMVVKFPVSSGPNHTPSPSWQVHVSTMDNFFAEAKQYLHRTSVLVSNKATDSNKITIASKPDNQKHLTN